MRKNFECSGSVSSVFFRMGIKNACSMLVALGVDSRRVYEEEFEEAFLRVSAEYYRAKSQNFLAENSASVYVKKVEECLVEESNRAKMYLDKGTEQKILDVGYVRCSFAA